jgi:hypothetical protein
LGQLKQLFFELLLFAIPYAAYLYQLTVKFNGKLFAMFGHIVRLYADGGISITCGITYVYVTLAHFLLLGWNAGIHPT